MSDDTFYLLVCRECTPDDPLVMPFESAEARGKWATAHTKGTGHDRWYVEDEVRTDNVQPSQSVSGEHE